MRVGSLLRPLLAVVLLGAPACRAAEGVSRARPATKSGKARPATTSADKKLTRRATLRYDIRGRPFPLPTVSGTIAGSPVSMLVDTGTNSHVVAGWLARKLALPARRLGDIGSDHVGKPIATDRIDDLEMTIDGWGPLSTTTVLATEVPDAFERLGIGALISPQRLDEEGDAVLLDLAKGELRSAWWEEARAELAAAGSTLVPPDQARACEENDGPVRGLAFVVPVTLDAHEARLLVDTGAQFSDVFTTSAVGQELARRSAPNTEAVYTVSGKVASRKRRGVRVTGGAFTTTAHIDLLEGAADTSCPRDGALAMDVLRSCALLLDRSQLYARCLPPK